MNYSSLLIAREAFGTSGGLKITSRDKTVLESRNSTSLPSVGLPNKAWIPSFWANHAMNNVWGDVIGDTFMQILECQFRYFTVYSILCGFYFANKLKRCFAFITL